MRRKALLIFAILVGGCWAIGGRPIVRPSFDGIVVDGSDDHPISGAIVIATWSPRLMFALESNRGRVDRTAEAVSDANGRFHLTAPLRVRRPWELSYDDAQPAIYAYCPGYDFRAKWLNQAVMWKNESPQERRKTLEDALSYPQMYNIDIHAFPRYQAAVAAGLAKEGSAHTGE